MAIEQIEPGRVLAGRYKLEQRMGEGGFGAIWRAEHLVLAAPVAVKLIDREVVHDDETKERFLREARSAATLRSPHVVQIIDYGVDGTVPFMVMELLEGVTLAQRIKDSKTLSAQDTVRVLSHVARAVARAHEAGIVHRDLKPENVFLVKNEDEEIAKVLDFGVAKVESAALLGPEGARTRTGSLLGTPYYMSPEQAQGNKAIDSRSDLWSLGVIAFECLTGTRPFFSDGLGDLVLRICAYPMPVPSQVAPVPAGFDEWFARACARDTEKRFRSARQMIDALREALGVESRDYSMLPDVLVSSESFPDVEPDEPAAAAGEPPRATRINAGGTESIDQQAKTIQARVEARTDEGPALTVRQFGTTQHTPAPPKRAGSGLVVAVAVAALGAGIAGGFVLIKRQRGLEPTEVLSAEPGARPIAPANDEPIGSLAGDDSGLAMELALDGSAMPSSPEADKGDEGSKSDARVREETPRTETKDPDESKTGAGEKLKWDYRPEPDPARPDPLDVPLPAPPPAPAKSVENPY
jgi:serine/threonine protein kinase